MSSCNGLSTSCSFWRIRSTRMVVSRIGLQVARQKRRLQQYEYHRQEYAGKLELDPERFAEILGDVQIQAGQQEEVDHPGQAEAAPYRVGQLDGVLRNACQQHLVAD